MHPLASGTSSLKPEPWRKAFKKSLVLSKENALTLELEFKTTNKKTILFNI